jgi:hypothetical protein
MLVCKKEAEEEKPQTLLVQSIFVFAFLSDAEAEAKVLRVGVSTVTSVIFKSN